MFTKTIKASLAAATISAATLGGIGLSMAAQTPSSDQAQVVEQNQSADQEVADQAADQANHQAEATAHLTDALAPLVSDGTITQAQSDAVVKTLVEAGPFGERGPRGHRGPRLDAAAEAIGIDVDTLKSELSSGKSVADVATEHGVSVDSVVNAIVADASAHLDQEVADGNMDQSKADEIKSTLTERITAMVNGDAPQGPQGPDGQRPPRQGDVSQGQTNA